MVKIILMFFVGFLFSQSNNLFISEYAETGSTTDRYLEIFNNTGGAVMLSEYSILLTKNNGNIEYLVTDAGMHTLLRPVLYKEYHKIKSLNNLGSSEELYTIAGPICESSDILAKNIMLPKQHSGNYLAICDVGAYGAVMASNYNSRGLPAEILVSGKEHVIVHPRELVTDIIKKDIIPFWLKN